MYVTLLACVMWAVCLQEVWVCVIVLGKEQREAASACPAPLQKAASLTRAHIRCHGFGR